MNLNPDDPYGAPSLGQGGSDSEGALYVRMCIYKIMNYIYSYINYIYIKHIIYNTQ